METAKSTRMHPRCGGYFDNVNRPLCHCEERSDEAIHIFKVRLLRALRALAMINLTFSLLDARAEGVQKAILFTGESNLSAQRAYTALGFRHVGDYRLLLLQSPIRIDSKATHSTRR